MLCSLSHAATWPGAGWKEVSLPHKMWWSVECFCLRRALCCLFFFSFPPGNSLKICCSSKPGAITWLQLQWMAASVFMLSWVLVPSEGGGCCKDTSPNTAGSSHCTKPTPLRCFMPMSLKYAFSSKHSNTHSVFGSAHSPDFPGGSQMHKWVGTSVEPTGGQGSKASIYPESLPAGRKLG